MQTLLIIANWLLPLLYLGLLIDYAWTFFLRVRQTGRTAHLPTVLAAHLAFLWLLGTYRGRGLPVNNYEVLSVLALGTALIYCIIEYATRERRTGVFVILIAFVMQYTASVFLPHVDIYAARDGERSLSQLHLLPAMVAYTAITISAIHGLLHLMALRDIKHQRFGVLFDRLPPVERLGTLCWHSLGLAFVFMTLAIISGAIMFSYHGAGVLPNKVVLMKILASSAAWLILAVAVVGRLIAHWPTARVSAIAIGGFVVVMAMLVVSIVLA